MLGRRQTSRGVAAAAAALAVLAAGCNRDSATTGPSGLQPKDFAANLRLVSGDQQAGSIAAALAQPITVRVVDAGGQPVQGATVTFAVRAGGGSVNPAANVSDNSGLVSATWTMGTTLGAAKVVATLTNVFVLDSATFTATATTGPASKFLKVSGDSQTTNASRALPAPLVVRVQDAFGNNLSGVKVMWAPSALNGTVTFAADTTAADGTASATWRLGTGAATQSLTASVTGAAPIGFTAIATPDTGRIFTITAGASIPNTAIGASVGTLTVKVTDQYLNVIAGAPITWNDSLAGGGTLSANTGVTSAAGVASNVWTLGRKVGPQFLRAKLTGRSETVAFTANGMATLTDVNVGNFSACGIVTDGTAMCWGYGADGQLGKLGNTQNTNALTTSVSTVDTLAGPFLAFRSINVGKNHTCGVTIGRDVYCWGSNNAGQLGGATAGGTPGKWKGDLPWVAVSAGEFNTCALTPGGFVYCSGLNDQGQIGNGSFAPGGPAVATPAQAASVTDSLFSAVAVGQSFACAMPRVGTAVPSCWGLNTSGQVGKGTASVRYTVPTRIDITLPRPTEYDTTSLVAGNLHACAIATVGGTVGGTYCWGGNGYGQVGDGSTINRNAPVLVSGGLAFVRLAAGAFHTCGLTAAGTAYCWGRNNAGQLGNNDPALSAQSAPVAVSTGVTFRSISAGELFTCGVVGVPGASGGTTAAAADVYCWGDNEYGQLGNTTIPMQNGSRSLVPVKISFTP